MHTFTVGGLRFVQIGQLSLSFCLTRRRAPLLDWNMVQLGALLGLAWSLAAYAIAWHVAQ